MNENQESNFPKNWYSSQQKTNYLLHNDPSSNMDLLNFMRNIQRMQQPVRARYRQQLLIKLLQMVEDSQDSQLIEAIQNYPICLNIKENFLPQLLLNSKVRNLTNQVIVSQNTCLQQSIRLLILDIFAYTKQTQTEYHSSKQLSQKGTYYQLQLSNDSIRSLRLHTQKHPQKEIVITSFLLGDKVSEDERNPSKVYLVTTSEQQLLQNQQLLRYRNRQQFSKQQQQQKSMKAKARRTGFFIPPLVFQIRKTDGVLYLSHIPNSTRKLRQLFSLPLSEAPAYRQSWEAPPIMQVDNLQTQDLDDDLIRAKYIAEMSMNGKQSQKILQMCAELQNRYTNPSAQIQLLLHSGRAAFSLQNWHQCMKIYEKAHSLMKDDIISDGIALSSMIQLLSTWAQVEMMLAQSKKQAKYYNSAEERLRECLKLIKSREGISGRFVNLQHSESKIYCLLARILIEQNQELQALQQITTAQKLIEETTQVTDKVSILSTKAAIFKVMKKPAQTIEYLQKITNYLLDQRWKNSQNQSKRVTYWLNFANQNYAIYKLTTEQSKKQTGLSNLQQVYRQLTNIKTEDQANTLKKARALTLYANTLYNQRQFQTSLKIFTQATDFYKKTASEESVIQIKQISGKMEQCKGKIKWKGQ